jgi:hypothetical protein
MTQPNQASGIRRILVSVVVCFVLGFAVAASIQWIVPLRRGLESAAREFGEAYVALYSASIPAPSGSAEYLVFMKGTPDVATYMRYFDLHPEIGYLSESIYPNAVRVSLKIPVGRVREDLESQPFARFVIKNYPFLLCH